MTIALFFCTIFSVCPPPCEWCNEDPPPPVVCKWCSPPYVPPIPPAPYFPIPVSPKK